MPVSADLDHLTSTWVIPIVLAALTGAGAFIFNSLNDSIRINTDRLHEISVEGAKTRTQMEVNTKILAKVVARVFAE